jgi:hypothetical protein
MHLLRTSIVVFLLVVASARAQYPVVLNVDLATDGVQKSDRNLLAASRVEIGWLNAGVTEAQVQAWVAAQDFAALDAAFNQVAGFNVPDASLDFDSGGGQYFESIEVVANGDTAGLAAFNNPSTGAKGKEMFSWVRNAVNPLATTEMAFVKFGIFPTTNDPNGSDWADTFIHSAPAIPWVGSIVPVTAGSPVDNLGAGNTAGDGVGATGSGFVLQLASVVSASEASLQFSAGTASAAENAGSVTVTVTRTGKLDNVVSVQFATADASAVAGTDYTATTGTLNFAASDVSETIVVPIADRASFQGERSFGITLSNPQPGGAAVLGAPATIAVTIQDDDPAMFGTLQLSAATYSVVENAGTLAVVVRRVGGSDGAVSATISTTPGTATSPADFTAVNQVVNFAAGDTADKTINISLSDDTTFEGDETFTVALSAATGGAVLGSPVSATVTITENDAPPTAGSISFSSATFSGAENAGSITIRATRTGGATGVVAAQYVTSNGTAVTPTDYSLTQGVVSWADGVSGEKTFTVPVVNNSIDETDKKFAVTLSNPTGGASIVAPASAEVTIVDDDVAGIFSFNAVPPVTVAETAGQITLTIVRTGGNAGPVDVIVNTSSGPAPAAAAGDFQELSNYVVPFANGQGSAVLAIGINDNSVFTGSRNFQVTLTSATGGGVIGANGNATVTITDNDTPLPGRFSFGAATYSAAEGTPTVTLTVIRTDGSDGEARVTYTAVNGTAIAPGDYPATSGQLIFAQGETSRTFTVAINDDTIAENAESLSVRLSNPTGGAALGARTSTIVTIADNEPTFRLSAATYSATEGMTLSVVVRRENGLSVPRSIDYRITNGTAIAGRDFVGASGSLLFDAGVAEQTLSIPILDDATAEGAETFKVTLVKVNAADLQVGLSTPSAATVTIGRSDATEQPDLSASGGSGFVGGGIFNGTSTGQTVIRTVKGSSSAGFTVRLKNAGTAPDSFVLKGTAGGTAPAGTVKITFNGVDVTARVLSADGYTRSNIAARGVIEFKVSVSARSGNAFAGYGLTLTAASTATTSKTDTIRVGVVRR